jgi:hypothetical protein
MKSADCHGPYAFILYSLCNERLKEEKYKGTSIALLKLSRTTCLNSLLLCVESKKKKACKEPWLLLRRNDGRGRIFRWAAFCPPLTERLIQPHIIVLFPSTDSMGLKAPAPASLLCLTNRLVTQAASTNELAVRALNNDRVTQLVVLDGNARYVT